MTTLKDRLTANQIAKLKAVGVDSLYGLVTNTPLGYHKILPIREFEREKEGVKYLADAVLVNIEHRNRGGRKFLVLDFESSFRFRTYFFSVAKYTLTQLKTGRQYQLLLTYNSGFWNLEKFADLKENKTEEFVLGRAKMKKHIDAYYSKQGYLHSGYFKVLYRRLRDEDFILNLEGLVPENDLIPKQIDMKKVHFPASPEEYRRGLNDWLGLNVFLRLSLFKYVNQTSEEKTARSSDFELDFLKFMTSKIPFTLSDTQKLAVWEILQDVGKFDKTV